MLEHPELPVPGKHPPNLQPTPVGVRDAAEDEAARVSWVARPESRAMGGLAWWPGKP